MGIKLASSTANEFATIRERRRRFRVQLSCFILVRPLEPDPEYFESIILTNNSSRDGLSFDTDNDFFYERMRLLVSYPFSLQPCAINRDYIGEVVRRDALSDGRYGIAIRFLTTAKLSVSPASNLRSNSIWNTLWQKTKTRTVAAKMNRADLRISPEKG